MKIIVSKEDKNYINECLETGEVLKEDLRRWFKEKWVDVSKKVDGKYPPCGRKDADGKSYPKCRPSKKVSKETPKITSSYSKKEKKLMTAQKRRAEKKNPKVGKGNKPTMTHFDENNTKDVKIVCDNCGWSWNLSDGGLDPYTCHKCGCNNSKKYKKMKLKITETQYIRIFEEGPVEETEFVPNDILTEAEYQGHKVQLGKIMQGDIKKFKVYVKNDKGKVVKVNFGFGGKSAHGKRMVIKKNNPERRKSFRARMRCDNPGPRWKPRYWACKTW